MQWSRLHHLLLTVAKPLWNWLLLKYPTLTLLAGPAPASYVRNCTAPPDHLHSEISFSRTCNHRCRSKQNFGGAKDFCPNCPNFPKKLCDLPTNFLSQGSWTEGLFRWALWKSLHLFLCKRWAPIFLKSNNIGRHLCPDFQLFCPDFRQIKTLGGDLGPPPPTPLLANLPYHWKNTKTRRSYLN